MKERFLAIGLASSIVAGCGALGDFDNNEGHIVAGVPATVVDTRYNKHYEGKYSTDGYDLYLDTEDCPNDDYKFLPGKDINPECELKRHKTDAITWRRFSAGDVMVWDGESLPSEVQGRLYRWEDGRYRERAYVFALTVEQCVKVEATESCVTDNVSVNAQTWLDYEIGDTIVFAGDPKEVVSQE